ncbi:hypothetical protein ACMA5I_06955 [Paracoccaceae bacterium GXU_MW_L88]
MLGYFAYYTRSANNAPKANRRPSLMDLFLGLAPHEIAALNAK